MALLTSLYLCSRTVYAAVGTPTGSGARVLAAAQTELPEGCLINGVITNEADLTAALKEFFTANKLPMNRVALIAGGSQFMHRILTLPAMSEKKRMAVLSHELASGGAEVRAPLDDYMLLSRDARTRVDTVLATRVEQSVIAGYDALAKSVGFKLYSIDLGLAAPIKAVRTIPDLQQKPSCCCNLTMTRSLPACLCRAVHLLDPQPPVQPARLGGVRHRDRAEALGPDPVPHDQQERAPH